MKRSGNIFTVRPRRAFLLWLAFCLSVLLVSALYANWHVIKSRNTNKVVARQLGFAGYACYETYTSLRGWFDERRLAFANGDRYAAFLATLPNRKGVTPTEPHLRNVVYLQLESVDGSSIRASYQGKPVMPFLNELSKTATYFPNTKDNTSAGRTTDGEFLVLCSLPPIKGKPIYVSYSLEKIPSLPRHLAKFGYTTISMHGNEGNFWNRENAHRQIGFQQSYFADSLDQSDMLGWGVSDESLLQQAAEKIIRSPSPVFAHLILLTNHHPYDHVGRRFGHERGDLVADHVDSLRYVDASIKKFFETLKSHRLLDSSIIAIYSDHDSAIEPLLTQSFANEKPSLLRDTVPFIVVGLEQSPKTYAKVAGLQDLPVVVLNRLGLPIPDTFTGNPLATSAPTYTPSGHAIDATGGQVSTKNAPVDLTTLTKLALLHPEKLQIEE